MLKVMTISGLLLCGVGLCALFCGVSPGVSVHIVLGIGLMLALSGAWLGPNYRH